MKRCIKRLLLIGTAALLYYTQLAHAEVAWNGFITVGGGVAKPSGEGKSLDGYETAPTFANDTVLGLQMRAPLSDKVSATGQMVSRGRDSYDVDMAWAYLSYEASEELTWRIGRFRTPFYLYSDYLEVSYAYHWISPPTDVYSLPADSIDGVDLVYQTPLGNADFTAQAYGGSVDKFFTENGSDVNMIIRNQKGLALTLNYDWLTLRASHHVAHRVSFTELDKVNLGPAGTVGLTITRLDAISEQLATNNATAAAAYASAADSLTVTDAKFTFDEVAFKIDWNNIIFVVEKTALVTDTDLFGDQNRMFVTAAYTFGSVQLHLSQTTTDDESGELGNLLPADVPDPATQRQFSAILNGISDTFISTGRTTDTLGLRWDFDPSAAFKIEVSKHTIDDGNDDTGGTTLRFAINSVF